MSKTPLILASGSSARQNMLRNAGIDFDIIPADIDEEKIIQNCESCLLDKKDTVLKLAEEKALSVSKNNPENYIVGSDQILVMDDRIFNKANNRDEAKERLKNFQGKSHSLMSAVCVALNNEVIWSTVDTARLYVKKMNEKQIDHYMNQAGEALTKCVGGYAIEGPGIRLFKEIEGDFFTIMGMPLLLLLNYLEKESVLS